VRVEVPDGSMGLGVWGRVSGLGMIWGGNSVYHGSGAQCGVCHRVHFFFLTLISLGWT
jgi:hypothetical protein